MLATSVVRDMARGVIVATPRDSKEQRKRINKGALSRLENWVVSFS